MTDLEMTKLCAKAMGVSYYVIPCLSGAPDEVYDPLHDDAQAMALVKKLRLTVMAAPLAGWIAHGGQDATFTRVSGADLNRAIVECAAQMQRHPGQGVVAFDADFPNTNYSVRAESTKPAQSSGQSADNKLKEVG